MTKDGQRWRDPVPTGDHFAALNLWKLRHPEVAGCWIIASSVNVQCCQESKRNADSDHSAIGGALYLEREYNNQKEFGIAEVAKIMQTNINTIKIMINYSLEYYPPIARLYNRWDNGNAAIMVCTHHVVTTYNILWCLLLSSFCSRSNIDFIILSSCSK